MPTTIVSPLVHSPDEHSIAAMFSEEAIQNIVAIQTKLKALLGDAIWLTPPQALHITLMEIICDTEYQELSRAQHFKQWYENYSETVQQIISQFRPFDVSFNELHASPAAIIIKAADTKPFNDLREAILAKTTLPAQTKTPPTIVHCTLARYNQVISLDDVTKHARTIEINFDEHISQFKLMKDLGPYFNLSVLQTYDLRN